MTDKDPRFEIENEDIKLKLRELGLFIKNQMPDGWGFGLFLFEYENKSMFWLSSANRQDIIKALKEFIQKEQAN